MVVLNDLGLTLEILGFAIFLFIPIKETFNLTVNNDEHTWFEKISNKLEKKSIRISGICLVFVGLAMQYSFLQ